MGTRRVTGRRYSARAGLVVVLPAFLSGTAAAQSSIAGLVTDETGGVLPGVTVEASSPAYPSRPRGITSAKATCGRAGIRSSAPGISRRSRSPTRAAVR